MPAPPPGHALCQTHAAQYEDWEDPSGGLLSEIFNACENDDADALGPLLDQLAGTQWGMDVPGPDGDTPL